MIPKESWKKLPTCANIGGVDYPITDNGNWSVAYDVICIFYDEDFSTFARNKQEEIFYKFCGATELMFGECNADIILSKQETTEEAFEFIDWFINCGEKTQKTNSTTQKEEKPNVFFQIDTPMIVEVMAERGTDPRGQYMHWWTFWGSSRQRNYDGGEFSNILHIRNKRNNKEKLSANEAKYEVENYYKIHGKQRFIKEDITLSEIDLAIMKAGGK